MSGHDIQFGEIDPKDGIVESFKSGGISVIDGTLFVEDDGLAFAPAEDASDIRGILDSMLPLSPLT